MNQETLDWDSSVYEYFDLVSPGTGSWRRWLSEGFYDFSHQVKKNELSGFHSYLCVQEHQNMGDSDKHSFL